MCRTRTTGVCCGRLSAVSHRPAARLADKLVSPQEICVSDQSSRVLVINPGSTSTKFGVFSRARAEWVTSVLHGDAELEQFRGRSPMAQADYRAGLIRTAVAKAGFDHRVFAAVAGRRGGFPPPPPRTPPLPDARGGEKGRGGSGGGTPQTRAGP